MCITHVCYTVSSAGTYIKMNGDMVTCYFHSGGMEACNCTLLITTKKMGEKDAKHDSRTSQLSSSSWHIKINVYHLNFYYWYEMLVCFDSIL